MQRFYFPVFIPSRLIQTRIFWIAFFIYPILLSSYTYSLLAILIYWIKKNTLVQTSSIKNNCHEQYDMIYPPNIEMEKKGLIFLLENQPGSVINAS